MSEKLKIGAQLYTVREHTQNIADFTQTIKKIAAIGYKYVQISGIGTISARDVADICAAHDLKIVLTHTAPARIKNETAAVIEEHRIMGAGLIGMGMMPGEYERTLAGAGRFIADFAPAACEIEAAGMRFMYHNHAFEFEKYENGKLLIELLADGWAGAGFTLDTYWVQAGGGDPADWLRRLKGRVPAIHLKDMAYVGDSIRMAEVGQGNLNWSAIFAACNDAGVEYSLVEQDDCYGQDPFDCLRTSFENIKAFYAKGMVKND
jgi:sugar phosphate isomerase/epimerase